MLSKGKIYLPIYDYLFISWKDDSATKYAYTGFSLSPCDSSTYPELLTKMFLFSGLCSFLFPLHLLYINEPSKQQDTSS